MRRIGLLPALIGLACFGLLSCADKSDIALTATLTEPRGQVAPGVFGSSLTGGVTLVLQVGEHASEKSTVTVEAFSLNSVAGETLLSPLVAKPLDATLPVVVQRGATSRVVFNVGPSMLTEAQAARLCEGEVVYTGSVSDSLAGDRVREVRSNPFMLACAP